MTKIVDHNRFEVFFSESIYKLLKNHLYNYLLRKEAVENSLKQEAVDRVLEVGSGISPLMTQTNRVVYTDISLTAIRTLQSTCGNGWYAVADCTRLPFKQNVFSHAICSEVLEHIPDDKAAIRELSRILKPSGQLIVTFPHRKFYFAIDDRLVQHYRRYEISEMEKKIRACGFIAVRIQKIFGPLEKLTMVLATVLYLFVIKIGILSSRPDKIKTSKVKNSISLFVRLFKWANQVYAIIVRLDAKVWPRIISTVLLMKCVLRENPK